MKYASAEGFRTALEVRLNALAAGQDTSRVRLRKMVVFDRLLARLLHVAPDSWVVKGGVALDLRFHHRARMTQDLDLARWDAKDIAADDFLTAMEVDIDDFFSFTARRIEVTNGIDDDTSVRYQVRSELAGRRFEGITVDVGFSGPLRVAPDLLEGSDILGFAELGPITVPVLPLEQHLAEKLHAYSRVYGRGRSSTRVKDLIDIVLISASASLRAQRLRSELELTFQARGTHDLPSTLPFPPEGWATPYRVLALSVGLDPAVAVGHQLAAHFFDPILTGSVADSTWHPAKNEWR